MKYLRRFMNWLIYIPFYTIYLRDASIEARKSEVHFELARRFFRYKLYLTKKK